MQDSAPALPKMPRHCATDRPGCRAGREGQNVALRNHHHAGDAGEGRLRKHALATDCMCCSYASIPPAKQRSRHPRPETPCRPRAHCGVARHWLISAPFPSIAQISHLKGNNCGMTIRQRRAAATAWSPLRSGRQPYTPCCESGHGGRRGHRDDSAATVRRREYRQPAERVRHHATIRPSAIGKDAMARYCQPAATQQVSDQISDRAACNALVDPLRAQGRRSAAGQRRSLASHSATTQPVGAPTTCICCGMSDGVRAAGQEGQREVDHGAVAGRQRRSLPGLAPADNGVLK